MLASDLFILGEFSPLGSKKDKDLAIFGKFDKN
jgi:hypothetical protein